MRIRFRCATRTNGDRRSARHRRDERCDVKRHKTKSSAPRRLPYAVDGLKAYRFTVRWGIETDTDDSEGRATKTSDALV